MRASALDAINVIKCYLLHKMNEFWVTVIQSQGETYLMHKPEPEAQRLPVHSSPQQ
jgi:hypothetical protein